MSVFEMKDRHGLLREYLAAAIGQKLIDVTTHYQQADLDSEFGPFIELIFENGNTVRFYSEGGRISIGPGIRGSD